MNLSGFSQKDLDKMFDAPFIVDMERKEAIQLLEEALWRVKHPQKNYGGGAWQAGGAYWRLFKVLREFVLPELIHERGHMFVILERFGLPVTFDRLRSEEKQKIKSGLALHHKGGK